MKKLFIISFLTLISYSYSQTSQDKENILAKIEELSTWSTFVGGEIKFIENIDYNPTTKQVTIVDFWDSGNDLTKYEITFYLDDIIRDSFRYGTFEFEGLYSPFVQIDTKNESVEYKSTKWSKGKEYLAVSEKTYRNQINLTANQNSLSKYLAKQYIELWYAFSECTSYTEIKN